MKTSNVWQERYEELGKPISVWVVDLLEDGVLQEARYLYGHNKHYAESLSENWDAGFVDLSQPPE